MFPISRDPPEGGTATPKSRAEKIIRFPISRDPPEGGTSELFTQEQINWMLFPISRDPPEGGTWTQNMTVTPSYSSFQFLGIPPKGELVGGCTI